VQETREAHKAQAVQFNDDLHAIFLDFQQQEKNSGKNSIRRQVRTSILWPISANKQQKTLSER
jgi:hypothetical protein